MFYGWPASMTQGQSPLSFVRLVTRKTQPSVALVRRVCCQAHQAAGGHGRQALRDLDAVSRRLRRAYCEEAPRWPMLPVPHPQT